TGSYGAGLARYLSTQGVPVVEVNRPDRQKRRQKGKSDPQDAINAAAAVQSGDATATPKAGIGIVEAIRVVRTVRASAVKSRTVKHRLNRGGDRHANAALYRIVILRLRYCAHTRAYLERRTHQGLSKKDIIRCLKRYLARQIYNALHADFTALTA